MTHDEIKKEAEICYQQIKDAEKTLRDLRAECKHDILFAGNYSWRTGLAQREKICDACGCVIR